MFFQNEDDISGNLDNLIGKLGVLKNNFKDLGKTFVNALDPLRIIKEAQLIAASTVDMTRSVLGQGREIGMQLSKTMANAREETLLFGVTNEQNVALFAAINKELKNTRYLTSEQIVDMQALAHTAGLTAEEMSKFVVNFDTLGVGTDRAIEHISKLQAEARSYGINVGQFMRGVGENMKLMASYNFKNGVDGLAKMVAQATSLRINMSSTVSFAEKLMDPSKAIETAAGFQMIGGAVGKLANPFELLHMAQTDMAGLQDELVKMSAAAVTFNEETGEFDIPVTELYRLREAAELTGIGYQDLTEMALNSAKKSRKLDILSGLSDIPDEQREMIANLSELKDGRLQIQLPGEDKMTDVAELTGTELKKMNSLQNEMNRSDKELAARSTTALEEIANKMAAVAAIPESMVLETGKFESTTESLVTSVDNFVEAMKSEIKSRNYDEGIDIQSESLLPELGKAQAEKVAKGIILFGEQAINAIKDTIPDSLSNAFGNINTIDVSDGDITFVADRSNIQVVGYDRSSDQEGQDEDDFIVTDEGIINPNPRDLLIGVLPENLAESVKGLFASMMPDTESLTNSFEPNFQTVTYQPSENSVISNGIKTLTDAISSINLDPNGQNSMNNLNTVEVNVGGTVTVNVDGTKTDMTVEEINRLVKEPLVASTIMNVITGNNNIFGSVDNFKT